MPAFAEAPFAEHPVALGSFRSWLRLLAASDGIDLRYLPRLLFASSTTLLTAPLRLVEQLRWGKAVESTQICPSPIIIIGHWRAGTTYLHNLLCQDPNLGYLTTFQGIAPGFCLIGERRLKPLLERWGRRNHPTRIIDNVPLDFDAPQEGEFAVANMSPFSFLHQFTLPRQAPQIFERYALFHKVPAGVQAEWTRCYLTSLRKATLNSGTKRLALKDPAHSARIPTILALFPDAKFLFLARNPYDVYLSAHRLWRTVIPRSQVQEVSKEQVDGYILQFYTKLLQKYLADKPLIPVGNLLEAKFEDLESEPLAQVRRVYEGLGLSGFKEAEPAFRAYLESIAGYQKNQYHLSDEIISKVNRHWRFAFEEWGYTLLEPR